MHFFVLDDGLMEIGSGLAATRANFCGASYRYAPVRNGRDISFRLNNGLMAIAFQCPCNRIDYRNLMISPFFRVPS